MVPLPQVQRGSGVELTGLPHEIQAWGGPGRPEGHLPPPSIQAQDIPDLLPVDIALHCLPGGGMPGEGHNSERNRVPFFAYPRAGHFVGPGVG